MGSSASARSNVWERVQEIARGVQGTFGLSYLPLGAGERYSFAGDELFYACSVIKVPLMCEIFRLAEKGRLDLARKLTLNRDDQVGGSGVLQVLTPGAELSVYDLMTLMIVVSDNTATNMLLDLIGLDGVTEFMASLGLPNIRLHHKLMVVEAGREQVNVMSPNDTTELMARVARNEIVSMRACEAMIGILKRQQYHDHLTKYLPLEPETGRPTGSLPSLEVAHKNGWIKGSRLCTGIFYLPGQAYVLSVFSKDVTDDKAADEAIARIGQLVYEWVAL